MKKRTRAMAWLLCICLALGLLSGCGETREAPAPEPSAAEPTPEPTPEPLDLQAIYAQAAEHLRASTDLKAEYSIKRDVSVPNYAAVTQKETTFAEKITRTASYEGLGSEAMRAVVENTIIYDTAPRITEKQIYADGVAYEDLQGALYYCRADEQLFLDGQLPLVLLDASLYGKLEGEEADGAVTIRFAEPTAAESWAMPQTAELQEAAGTAIVSAQGQLTGFEYSVSYRYGGLAVSYRVEAKLSVPEELDLSASVPENTKAYESLDNLSVPLMLKRADYLLLNAESVSAVVSKTVASEASGHGIRSMNSLQYLARKTEFLFHEESSGTTMDLNSGKSQTNAYESTYSGGKLTVRDEQGREETEPISSADMRSTCTYFLEAYFPGADSLTDAQVRDAGDYWLIYFTGNEDFGVQTKDLVCTELFEDPTILDTYATAYTTRSCEGYVALEKVSGLPTAMNLDFAGIHTIEGAPYVVRLQLNIGMSLCTADAAEEILDEPIDGPEPEKKPTPVFYEVSDEEGHRMYLFGTIHIGDDRTAYLPQVIWDALDASDALAVEFDTDSFTDRIKDDEELQKQLVQAYYYLDGTTIQNHLDSEVYKAARDPMIVTGNYTDTAESMKPFLWSNAIESFYLSQGRDLSAQKGVDMRLMRRAREAGKEILDVESGQFQINMFGSYSDAVQEMLLSETLSTSRSEYLNSCKEIYERWCEGDEAALKEQLAAMSEEERAELDEDELAVYDEYHKAMELDRNAQMAVVAGEYLQSGKTVFYAVGLAHLLGEGGLVEALRELGYTVKLIDTH